GREHEQIVRVPGGRRMPHRLQEGAARLLVGRYGVTVYPDQVQRDPGGGLEGLFLARIGDLDHGRDVRSGRGLLDESRDRGESGLVPDAPVVGVVLREEPVRAGAHHHQLVTGLRRPRPGCRDPVFVDDEVEGQLTRRGVPGTWCVIPAERLSLHLVEDPLVEPGLGIGDDVTRPGSGKYALTWSLHAKRTKGYPSASTSPVRTIRRYRGVMSSTRATVRSRRTSLGWKLRRCSPVRFGPVNAERSRLVMDGPPVVGGTALAVRDEVDGLHGARWSGAWIERYDRRGAGDGVGDHEATETEDVFDELCRDDLVRGSCRHHPAVPHHHEVVGVPRGLTEIMEHRH